jgi:hypothetical protein
LVRTFSLLYPCKSGTPAVVSRARSALLLSQVQASGAELVLRTLAEDDTQQSGLGNRTRLLRSAVRKRKLAPSGCSRLVRSISVDERGGLFRKPLAMRASR